MSLEENMIIDNRARTSETTRGTLHWLKTSWTLAHRRLKMGLLFLLTIRKFCILLHCQALHMEVSKQNSTKLCNMLGSELDLQMHVKIWGVYPPKNGELKTPFLWRFSSRQNYARWQNIRQEVLPTFHKCSSWLQCQWNKVVPHSECKLNHRL